MTTLPRGSRATIPGLTFGEFVKRGDSVVLLDAVTGATYDSERVNIVQGALGGRTDGFEGLPRPTVYSDENSRVVERQGDRVIIGYMQDKPGAPIVLGVIRAVNGPDFLRKSYAEAGYDGGQRVRFRMEPRNTSGASTGRLDVRVCDDATGTLDVRGTEAVSLRVASDTEGEAFTDIVVEDGTVTVTVGATTIIATGDKTTVSSPNVVLAASVEAPTATAALREGVGFQANLSASLTEIATLLGMFGLAAPITASTMVPTLQAQAYSSPVVDMD